MYKKDENKNNIYIINSQVRTLEAPPLGLDLPQLMAYADSEGVHEGVNVEWGAPSQPNGVILRYEVYRRKYTGLNVGKFAMCIGECWYFTINNSIATCL